MKKYEKLIVGETVTSYMIQELTGICDYEGYTLIQGDNVKDIIGKTGVYDTFVRKDTSMPFKYAGECKANSINNLNAEISPLVYICSQFAGKNEEGVMMHEKLAMYACEQVIAQGGIPVAPHLYFPRFMDDSNPEHRDFGLAAGIRALAMCDRMMVYIIDGVISDGMEAEIWNAIYNLRVEPEYINMTSQEVKAILDVKYGVGQKKG